MVDPGLDTAPLGAAERRVQRLIRDALPRLVSDNVLDRYGAFGLGIGRKRAGGPVALRFYVACKLPGDRLAPSRRIPGTVRIADEGGGAFEVPTDVVERVPPALAMPDGRHHRREVGARSRRSGRPWAGGWETFSGSRTQIGSLR